MSDEDPDEAVLTRGDGASEHLPQDPLDMALADLRSEIRARLRLLGASQHGNKEVSWTRLSKAEAAAANVNLRPRCKHHEPRLLLLLLLLAW